jgi:hypothetical protein
LRNVPVSVRLDPQVLDWLRAKGAGHLTRINDILTNLDRSGAAGWDGEVGRITAFAVGIYCNPRSQKRELGHKVPRERALEIHGIK